MLRSMVQLEMTTFTADKNNRQKYVFLNQIVNKLKTLIKKEVPYLLQDVLNRIEGIKIYANE